MGQPTPEFQIQFLSNLQRLLTEGLFVATYKYALLMALADICIEQGREDEGALELPTRLIAASQSSALGPRAQPNWLTRPAAMMPSPACGPSTRILTLFRRITFSARG